MHEYSLRPATSADFSFLRELHRQTLRPYVEQIWGWDEQQQENLLRERFAPEKLQVIQIAGKDTGILQVETKPNEVFLANILLAPEFQKRGLGRKIVSDVVEQAKVRGLPVALTVLKPNPAKRLYERLGFQVTKEDEVRYFMSHELQGVRIEKFDPSRHGHLVKALTDLLHSAYAPLAKAGMRYWASYQTPAETLHRLQLGEAYIAFCQSNPVGTISLVGPKKENKSAWYKKDGVYTFHQFGVSPEFQGRGVGRALLDFVERRAAELGALELALDTSENAENLIRSYEKRGYRFVDQVQWDSTNYLSVVMSKPYHRSALELPEASAVFRKVLEGYKGFWCVAGGWAIDLYLGRRTRAHEDLEIVALREEWPVMQNHFRRLGARKIFSGDPPKFVPWEGGAIDQEVIQLRLAPQETSVGYVDFDLLLTPSEAGQWICRRDETIRLPIAEIIGVTKDGIPFLAPEIVLLFKAKRTEEKDERDFQSVFDSLNPKAHHWLSDALMKTRPDHPWLARLSQLGRK